MTKKAVVITFPGSNCDAEAAEALCAAGFNVSQHWYADTNLPDGLDLCFIPGGFSYGDYLRSGAIAGTAPVMPSVAKFADRGGYVIGVCNGFQILTEAKILEGALVRNSCGHFVCKITQIERVCDSVFTRHLPKNLKIQVAHADGHYIADENTIKRIEDEDRVAFRYVDNFNGSINKIAGIIGGKHKNILGMMPHPERTLASADAFGIFTNIFAL